MRESDPAGQPSPVNIAGLSRQQSHPSLPLIVETLARLRSRSCIIDGEAVACDDNGVAGQDQGSFFRRQTAPWKYSYMLGGMVSLCSLAMCLRTISEYRKRSPQMRQCHWSRAKMYGRHSELFGSSLGLDILIISRRQRFDAIITRSRRYRSDTRRDSDHKNALSYRALRGWGERIRTGKCHLWKRPSKNRRYFTRISEHLATRDLSPVSCASARMQPSPNWAVSGIGLQTRGRAASEQNSRLNGELKDARDAPHRVRIALRCSSENTWA